MNNFLTIIMCLLFSACATQKTSASLPSTSNETKAIATTNAAPPVAGSVSAAAINAEALEAAKAEAAAAKTKAARQTLALKSVYFDFDKDTIKPDYREVIEQAANLLSSNSNVIVTLEGNADERGSAAYNLALGDRRASSVRKALELFGIQISQIKVVSFGKEKPRLTCHEEKCWHENRRVDFVPR